MIAVDPNFFDCLVNCAEATGNLRAICVGELVGKRNEIFFFRDHVFGHPAVALPAVGTPVFFTCAGNHVSAATIVANAAAGNVIHNHPVAHTKATTAWLRPLRSGRWARGQQ